MQVAADALKSLASRLSRELEGDLYCDPYQRALYSTDASLYQIQPLAVAVPRTVHDVRCTVQAAAELGVPLVARGAGTSLSGQSIGPGIVIDFSKHLNAILEIDVAQRLARVQPGVVLDHFNQALATQGLQFGPDVATSSRANLGGMMGNNSSGSRSIRHGKTVDHVVEMDVVLADGNLAHFSPQTGEQLAERLKLPGREGEIYRAVATTISANREEVLARYPRVLRRVSGYNLDEFIPETRAWYPPPYFVQQVRAAEARRYGRADFNLSKLIVGSEGTLATITEALVHVIPLPAERGILVLHFQSLAAACAALGATLELDPSAVEFFDGLIVKLARQSLEYRHYLDFVVGEPETLIIVEFSADDPAEIRHKIDLLSRRLRSAEGLYHMLPALDARLRDHIWACRKAALPLLMGIPGRRKPIAFVEDTAVHPARIPEFVARFREILRENGTDGAFYGHASVGCLHIRPLLDAADPADRERLRKISLAVCDLVLEFGGAMSGEHGDGLARSYLNEKLFGPKLYQAFRQIKAAFDPRNLLNPGKIVDAPSPVENLRWTDQPPLDVPTVQDFSREGGLFRAADLCNGSGLCRKTRTGTMCPSFMATGDEEHSTRGRANALRLVLSGALPARELTGEKLFHTFDLCLQCKGCKAECPSNVDVAKLKVEFLHGYYQAHGAPLGTRLLARAARLNRLGAALAPISNWLYQLPGAGWAREKLLGIDRRRPLPRFHRRHFRRWFARHRPPSAGTRGKIILLDDCLTSYCEPQVNQAAVALLEAAGYEVQLAGLGCCGRTLISKGFLDEAQRLARANIARLLPWAEQGVFIVGAEPSCLLTLVDEYPDLVPGEGARVVASRARLIDGHLVQQGIELPWKQAPGAIEELLVHAHCQQKALVGPRDMLTALRSVPGVQAKLVDAGCCGMAGSFGYEHYDLSMKIGERVLLPAVRAAGEKTIIAPGFSCRHQIHHGAGRRAEHPVEFLARHL